MPTGMASKPFPILDARLSISRWRYLLYCALVALFLRVILCMFKARGIQRGEHLKDGARNEYKKFWSAFWVAFKGFGGGMHIEDLWFPYLIGVGELAAYAVLLASDRLEIIAGWLVLKVAGGWSVWQHSRTAFNRFLVINLLDIAIAYFWLSRYVVR